MYLFSHWLVEITSLLVLFCLFRVYFLSSINQLTGKHFFHVINYHHLYCFKVHLFYHSSIDQTNLSISFFFFCIFVILTIKQLKSNTCFWMQFLGVYLPSLVWDTNKNLVTSDAGKSRADILWHCTDINWLIAAYSDIISMCDISFRNALHQGVL